MQKSGLKPGMKVHYVPMHVAEKDCDSIKCQNGIIKSLTEVSESHCHVVYKCNNDWVNYMKYTGVLTRIADLREGWL